MTTGDVCRGCLVVVEMLRRLPVTVFTRPHYYSHNVWLVSLCSTSARYSGSSGSSSSSPAGRLIHGCRQCAIVTTRTVIRTVPFQPPPDCSLASRISRHTAPKLQNHNNHYVLRQDHQYGLLSVVRLELRNDRDRFKPPTPNIRRRRYIQTSTTPPTISNHMNNKNKTATMPNINPTATATNTEDHVETNGCFSGDTSSSNDRVRQNHYPYPPPPPPPYTVVVQHWLQQLRAIPNLITLSRILLIPFLSFWIIQHQTLWALIGCVYAAGSDVLDGYLARKYPATMQTPLGTYLDPLADKLFINVISISLWVNGTLPTTLVGLWLIRDIVLMIATHHFVAQNTRVGMAVMDPVTVPIQVTPTTLSKINTALQFITLVVAIAATPPMVAVATDTTAAVTTMMTTSTMETLTTDTGSTTQYDSASHIHHDDMFFGQRQYITDHILSPLCWVTGATTIASSLSYYGHSAFIATDNRTTAPNATSHTDRHSAK